MVKIIVAIFILNGFCAASLYAEGGGCPLSESRQKLFEVETTEEDAAESLNRISGDIDRGFSSPEQTYESASHGKAGPLAKKPSDSH